MNKFRYLKIFIFIMIIFLNFNVFASDYNLSSKIKATTSGATGKYYGLEIYNSGTNNLYSVGTRYNGRLSKIEFYVNVDDFDWNYNKTYTMTLNMATEDWRNNFMGPIVMSANLDGTIPSSSHNMFVSNSFQFISMKKIKFNFKIPSTLGPYIKFTIYSTNVSSNYITGVSNWNLSSIYISDISSSSVTPTPAPVVTPTPTPTSSNSTNQDIINNQNSNTNSIINNQNSNTNSIINNQNSNTNSIIESNSSNTTDIIDNANANTENIINNNFQSSLDVIKALDTCLDGSIDYDKNNSTKNGYFIGSNETYVQNSSFNTIQNILIAPNHDYTLSYDYSNVGSAVRYCLYDIKGGLISCSSVSQTTTFNSGDAFYLTISVRTTGKATLSGLVCKSKTDTTNEKLTDINNSLNDTSTPTIDIDINTASDTPIIDLIYMPLAFIDMLLDEGDNTCSPYVLPFDFSGGNNTLTLPCINLQTLLGNDFYNILNAVICFYMAYNIGLMCVTIYNDLTSLRDGFRYMYYSNDPDVIGFGKEGDNNG